MSSKRRLSPQTSLNIDTFMKWLRDRATVLLSEGRWFDSPGLQVGVSLGKILNPKLLGKAVLNALNVNIYVDATLNCWVVVDVGAI